MFTGLVEEVGRVRAISTAENGRRIIIDAERTRDGLAIGDSIAIDGVCQTVIALDDTGFAVESIATTLSRTTLGLLEPGSAVNLERALAVGDRFGGHFVQGHVDGVGSILRVQRDGEHVLIEVDMPPSVADVTVLHGSIAIHGVSLTVNALPAENQVQVAIIPHTWQHTNLRHMVAGDRVNLEGDMIGRFVAHWLHRRAGGV